MSRTVETGTRVALPDDTETFQYSQLAGNVRTDGRWITGEQLRMDYIQRTDKLIYRMTHGLEVVDPISGETVVQKPDVVVWLDKSARPLAWLTSKLWPKLARDPETGEIPKKPEFKFVNIDREQWVNALDAEGNGNLDINRIDQSLIRSLRSIFVSPKLKEHGLTPAIDAAETSLDHKTIMIVDEVRASGHTLKYAKAFLQRAFPTASIGGMHWMSEMTMVEGVPKNADNPIWYKQRDATGRGVGDRNDELSGRSPVSTQKLGRYFLSTRLRGGDPKSIRLRQEITELAQNADVPYRPTTSRPKEDQLRRLASYNGLPVEEVLKQVRKIKAQR